MIKNDNMQARMTVLQMENVRLTNEIARLNGYIAFVEEENHNIEKETREECRQELEMALMERDRAMAMVESANKEISREKQWADNYYALLEEARKALENKNAENAELKRRIAELEQFKDAAAFAEKNCVDAKEVINVMKRRIFPAQQWRHPFPERRDRPPLPDVGGGIIYGHYQACDGCYKR